MQRWLEKCHRKNSKTTGDRIATEKHKPSACSSFLIGMVQKGRYLRKEIWKPINGYEGYYEISNLGNVKSVKRFYRLKENGKEIEVKEKCINPFISSGYSRVSLTKNGKSKKYSVHRIVAEAFIPNPNNLPLVNHKDETRNNNCVNNLEWCTHSYNINYGTTIERISKSVIQSKATRKVNVYKDNLFIGCFGSVREAITKLNISGSNIYKCLIGKQNTACGYSWRYCDD